MEGAEAEAEAVEAILGYKFVERQILAEALTHPSFNSEKSYGRLKLLGRSIINVLVSTEVIEAYPALSRGNFDRLCDASRSNERLARAAVAHNLQLYLHHNDPNLENQIQMFKDSVTGCRPPKVLAGIVKSLIGAVHIDSSKYMETTDKSMEMTLEVLKRLVDPLICP